MSGSKLMWIVGGVLVAIVLVAAIPALMGESDASGKPHSIVTTIKSDPKTSRAFTWHTNDVDTETVVQLVKGARVESVAFDGDKVITVQGQTSSVTVSDGSQRGVHKANAEGLEPGTNYTYRVGNGDEGGWSRLATFETEKEQAGGFTFINVTDTQGKTEQDFALWGETLEQAFKVAPDAELIIHNGDFTDNPADEMGWEYFFDKAKRWVTSIPLMPVTGNHDEVKKDANHYVSHFNVPDNGSPDPIEGTTYSFDYGSVHFVMLNTESKVKEQAEWLKQDLSATSQPWKIVALHDGPYGGSQEDKPLKHWVPLFDEYGVDLVLQGHNHEYVRSKPMKGDKAVEAGEGTVYVVVNSAGPKFNSKKEDMYYHKVHFSYPIQMFAAIRVEGDQLTYQAYDADGHILDQFNLNQE